MGDGFPAISTESCARLRWCTTVYAESGSKCVIRLLGQFETGHFSELGSENPVKVIHVLRVKTDKLNAVLMILRHLPLHVLFVVFVRVDQSPIFDIDIVI